MNHKKEKEDYVPSEIPNEGQDDDDITNDINAKKIETDVETKKRRITKKSQFLKCDLTSYIDRRKNSIRSEHVELDTSSSQEVFGSSSSSSTGAIAGRFARLLAAPVIALAHYRRRKPHPEVDLRWFKRFSLRELQVASDNFSNENLIARCGSERPESQLPLDWPKRKRIALGSARVMKQVGEAEIEKNIALMQEFTAVTNKAQSEISTLQLNVDCLNDQSGELKSNQLRMEANQLCMETILNHHCAENHIMDQNIKKLCAAVNITPDQLNPAADDKKGEEESAKRTVDDATIQVRDQRAAAGKPSEEEVLEEEADDKVEPKDVAKTDKELAASKYSAEEQLNPDVKYKRIEDIKARFEADERREKLKGLADVFSSGEDESSDEVEEEEEEEDEEAED
ncbi:hypothetical protein RD792_013176 [Penstemon davidsonii]|uniref:Uncharacterized protein n=1 Tax=Penstemon davidsonii TaxID=160366 RepID=A0ABR0CTM1_9LAMI|nr:hypothetical protein RD792_013176 [Penstemon davidsonii]